MVLIGAHIVKTVRIGHPHETAIGIGDYLRSVRGLTLGSRLTRAEVADPDRIKFRACLVGAPAKLGVIGGVAGRRDVEEALSARFHIAVEKNFRRPAGALFAAKVRVLSALLVAFIIEPGTIRAGNFAVIFLDPPAHLLEERRPQCLGWRELGPGIVILGLEHGTDIARQGGGIAQNLLPILGFEPFIVIAEDDPVQTSFRTALLNRRRHRLMSRGRLWSRSLKLAHPLLFLVGGLEGAVPPTA